MRQTLKEELERIHQLTYGKKLNESFLDTLLNKIGIGKSQENKPVYTIDQFYKDLQLVKDSGGIFPNQDNTKNMKGIKTVQIGLLLLGYRLPSHGVDGVYGTETQEAVQNFKRNNRLSIEDNSITPQFIDILIAKLNEKNITNDDIAKYYSVPKSGQGFTDIDLSTDEGFKQYSDICQKVIDRWSPNPLNITGNMMATGAKQAFETFHKLVPPELALSQLKIEGGISNGNTSSRPIRTMNPFNVGNTDSGSNVSYDNVQDSINKYYNLIASKYMGTGSSASDLAQNFVTKQGNRYASDPNYESKINKVIGQINQIV